MEWISVDDRMPISQDIEDYCNDYLLVKPNGYSWCKAMYCNNEFYTSYNSRLCVGITHWMVVDPVPEPPKE